MSERLIPRLFPTLPYFQFITLLNVSFNILFVPLFQAFTGNNDRNTEKKNVLHEGLLTRWLRFMGKTGQDTFCMRTEVFGVKQKPGKTT